MGTWTWTRADFSGKYSRFCYSTYLIGFSKNNNFKYISLLSTFLTIFDIMHSHSTSVTFNIFYHSTFCPNRPFLLSTLCLLGVLSHSTLCPFDIFYNLTFCHSAFCPIRHFVLPTFLLSAFLTSTFCR